MGTHVHITSEDISREAWALQASSMGWQQLYILPVAVLFAQMFQQVR
jgi:hypothetical protein